MEIQERDKQIIQFITDFKITTIPLTSSLYYPDKTSEPCRKRLQILYQNKYIDRTRDGFGRGLLYYPRYQRRFSPTEEYRRLCVTRFYVDLMKATHQGVVSYETYTKADFAPFDLIVKFRFNGGEYVAFVNASIHKNYPKDKIEAWYKNRTLFATYLSEHYGHVDKFLFVNLVDRSIHKKRKEKDSRFNITELDIQSEHFIEPLIQKLKPAQPAIVKSFI